jgi:hypothetical protein
VRIIALDPGKDNFAAAVMEDRKVLETRYLVPLKSLLWSDFTGEVKTFRDSYFKFLSEIEPDCVLAERFMARPGVQRGAVGEYINIMLGIVSVINASKGIPTHLVTSAQWKTYLAKRYGEVPRGKGMRKHFPHLSIHEADALGIAVYAMEGELGEQLLKRVARLRRYPHVGIAPTQ